jgi:hypothetical protein
MSRDVLQEECRALEQVLEERVHSPCWGLKANRAVRAGRIRRSSRRPVAGGELRELGVARRLVGHQLVKRCILLMPFATQI